jgi:hypothetical protein
MIQSIYSATLVLALFFGCPGAVNAAEAKKGPSAPPWLLSDVPPKYQEAAKAVALVLVGEKEDPAEFKAEVEEREEGEVFVFHLWHLSAFTPENKNAVGNPGGKCRDISFYSRTGKASRSMFWR